MYSKFGCFLDGAWRRGSASLDVVSPVTKRLLGQIAAVSSDDTLAALDAAARAQAPLLTMGGFARADALHRIADEM
jgi:succinate-semialdehyde dehydrogenase/glutarate-semialdehyde dehydrogenase